MIEMDSQMIKLRINCLNDNIEKLTNKPIRSNDDNFLIEWKTKLLKTLTEMLPEVIKLEQDAKKLTVKLNNSLDLKPIDTEWCDLMTISEFTKQINEGCMMPYDGDGYYATDKFESDLFIDIDDFDEKNIPELMTHVCWYAN